ncbi:hypothetical protein F5X68DRAFT_49977 [Plectosphaerella plurivora]|uniref:Uncharacterized protein n=1 Tax=Plectosphaerella plurivora TaxID=936078 RepID=A0A9P9A649_9PEZI|nr:hypothetical protein F5X68DRAFT_49977 [Plectosphaerella plurivora]
MPPSFRISRPEVLTPLPRPLLSTNGEYHSGEVYTQQPGGRKRKRLEVAIGIDSISANIYHVPSAGVRTSFEILPTERFTTAPYSIRYQIPDSKIRQQFTYYATKNVEEDDDTTLTMCKNSVDWSGKTSFERRQRRLAHKSPIKHLFTAHEMPTDGSMAADFFAVCEDGQIMCIDGRSLDERWTTSAFSLIRELLPRSAKGFEVEAAFNDSAAEVMASFFENRQDAVASFGRNIDPVSFNPDVIILVAKSLDDDSRHFIVLGALCGSELDPAGQNLVQMHIAPLPSHGSKYIKNSLRLSVRTAKLREIAGECIQKYDLSNAVPKLVRPMKTTEDIISYVPMSEHTMVTATQSHLTVTNSTYHATQAQSISMPADQEAMIKNGTSNKTVPDLTLVTYLYKLDLVVAMGNNNLYAIQVNRRTPYGMDGMIIDSLGSGIIASKEFPDVCDIKHDVPFATALLSSSLSENYALTATDESDRLDALLKEGNLREFERQLAAKFRIGIEEGTPEGDDLPDWKWPVAPISVDTFAAPTETSNTALVAQDASEDAWLLQRASRRLYPEVDNRWVAYAISRVFELVEGDNGRPKLELYLSESNVLTYLVVAGHLNLSNMKAAFQVEYIQAPVVPKKELAEQLIQSLIEVDPSRALLLSYLTATTVGEVELLVIIRTIMRNLVEQPRLPFPKQDESVADEEHLSLEIELLERELEKAEYKLVDESDIHARLLTAACEKLAGYSPQTMVKAMRHTLSPIEILSLIHLLRIQLVGSAWTSKYSDTTGLDKEDTTQRMPDGAIALIAELLSRCIDAVGNNGWLTSGTTDDLFLGGRFITALKLEVSAAVDGLNDAIALNGMLGEAVSFGEAFAVAESAAAAKTDKPQSLEVAESVELPMGLAHTQAVSHFKVVSGGEVISRSAREKGHLISQRIEDYSLERIVI